MTLIRNYKVQKCVRLSCPQCEKMDLRIIQSLLERVQKHKKAVKPLWDQGGVNF